MDNPSKARIRRDVACQATVAGRAGSRKLEAVAAPQCATSVAEMAGCRLNHCYWSSSRSRKGQLGMAEPPLIFVRRSFSAFGGGELILQQTMAALAARGRRVAILSTDWPKDRMDGIEHIACPRSSGLRFLRARSFANAACRAISTAGPALVQSNERIPCCDIFRAGDGIHAAYLERRRRHASPLSRAALAVSLFHREMLRLERDTFASGRLKAVIAISEMVAEDIRRHFDFPVERIHCIPNGIDLDRFRPELRARHRADLRARLGVADDRPVILFVGSGFARKGVNEAMEALARLGGDAELWVVGQDARTESFAARARRLGIGQRVRFVGPCHDTLPWYGAADVLTLPSLYEPFGTVVLEAMASGLPAVVSGDCGARELVRRFDPALVVQASDPEALAGALNRALGMAGLAETACLARQAASHYGRDGMVDRMLALYRATV
jgi:UDP-glucose:(heptosyl)LPS alpha-1,3-glucosyltransferase